MRPPKKAASGAVKHMDKRLEPYRALVPFLGPALGPDYEVALHDLTSETGAVAVLANGGVTGQSLGAPLRGMARRFVQDGLWRTREFVAGYQAESAAKGRLRASALFIRDGEELIGMLCLYFDAAKYSRMAQELLALCGLHGEGGRGAGAEPLTAALPDTVRAAVEEVTGRAGLPPERLTMEEKIRIVETLHRAGLFSMKGAVSEVAAQLGASEATVYRYLSKLKG